MSDHTLSKGKLQSVQLPHEKWQEISLSFITDLPLIRNRTDSILNVVDKPTRMVHLIRCREDITAADTARLVWQRIVELHGAPRVIFPDRRTQFTSNFWQELWKMTGTVLKFSTSYHPQTQYVVERMNSVVSQTLRCILTESGVKDWEQLSYTKVYACIQKAFRIACSGISFGEMHCPQDARFQTPIPWYPMHARRHEALRYLARPKIGREGYIHSGCYF